VNWNHSVYVSNINLIYVLELFMLHSKDSRGRGRIINISAISWRSVLLMEERGVPRENHQPIASHWQTVSHNVVSSTHRHERDSNFSGDKALIAHGVVNPPNPIFGNKLMFRHKPPTTRKQGYILRYMTKNYKWLKKSFYLIHCFFLMLNCITFVQSLDCQMWW
jgi:hypothetical protein